MEWGNNVTHLSCAAWSVPSVVSALSHRIPHLWQQKSACPFQLADLIASKCESELGARWQSPAFCPFSFRRASAAKNRFSLAASSNTQHSDLPAGNEFFFAPTKFFFSRVLFFRAGVHTSLKRVDLNSLYAGRQIASGKKENRIGKKKHKKANKEEMANSEWAQGRFFVDHIIYFPLSTVTRKLQHERVSYVHI